MGTEDTSDETAESVASDGETVESDMMTSASGGDSTTTAMVAPSSISSLALAPGPAATTTASGLSATQDDMSSGSSLVAVPTGTEEMEDISGAKRALSFGGVGLVTVAVFVAFGC